MWSLGPLAFAAPWVLAAVAALPVLYWLLRVTPPSPRLIRFPAIRLLFGLSQREDTPAHTPWWVVLLRMTLALLVILGLAHPLINPGARVAAQGGPLLIAVDDGWASARNWDRRRQTLDSLFDQAERAGRPVILLTTAPPAGGGPIAASPMMAAAALRPAAQAMAPKPWPVDRAAAAAALKEVPKHSAMQAVWLSDGIDDGRADTLARTLQAFGGGLEILTDGAGETARLVHPPRFDAAGLTVRLSRAGAGPEPAAHLRLLDSQGRLLAREQIAFPADKSVVDHPLTLPPEMRNRIVRMDIEGERGAGSVALLDERWRRRPVGLVSGAAADKDAPLLSNLYYVERALAPFAELRKGDPGELLKRELAVLMLADVGTIGDEMRQAMARWIEQGGVLVRFAGPRLAYEQSRDREDALLPVRLRGGGRAMGGTMSWTEPMPLAAFPDTGPFEGLAVPAEVKVSSQVLAEPSLDLGEKTWARLADGTPLVTAEARGQGHLVLIHTTANAEWSNLALSGVFVDMLRRLVAMSQGVREGQGSNGLLAAAELLDGFGRPTAPSGAAAAIPAAEIDRAQPGPRHPPGFYGAEASRRALNLAPSVGALQRLTAPSGSRLTYFSDLRREIDLKPWLLTAALALALMDTLVALGLRGLLRATAKAGLVALLLLPGDPAEADDFAMKAGLEPHLAFVRTGDAAIDKVSEAGLAALSDLLQQRTSVSLGQPMGVDVESDPLLFFPLLYWPVTPLQTTLSAASQTRVNDFMRQGGMIVFDTGDLGAGEGSQTLRGLTQGLSIPPLAPVTEEHVLTRAFYLLKELPGRYGGGTVWVEQEAGGTINDGVSPVVIGGHDWAAAWAADANGRPMFAAVPGGERQRELAYRFGVNLVMYALTGNYKADQVHLPHILERLGR